MIPRWTRGAATWTAVALLLALAAGVALRVVLPPGDHVQEVAPPAHLWPPAPPDAQ